MNHSFQIKYFEFNLSDQFYLWYLARNCRKITIALCQYFKTLKYQNQLFSTAHVLQFFGSLKWGVMKRAVKWTLTVDGLEKVRMVDGNHIDHKKNAVDHVDGPRRPAEKGRIVDVDQVERGSG